MAGCGYYQARRNFYDGGGLGPKLRRSGELPANKKTLLIADDDPAILKLLSGLLADELCVITADNGERALEQSRSFAGQIHVLLTDITMPSIDLATQIATQRPEIKVVLMSGFNDDTVLPNQGPHYLSKPFKPSQLINLVNGLLAEPNSKFTAA